MASDRTKRILQNVVMSDATLSFLNLPSYETTKGTFKEDQEKALKNFDVTNNMNNKEEEERRAPFSDSGSEYVPSDTTVISETESEFEEEPDLFPLFPPINTKAKFLSLKQETDITSSTDQIKIKEKSRRGEIDERSGDNEVTSSESFHQQVALGGNVEVKKRERSRRPSFDDAVKFENLQQVITINHSEKIDNKRFRNKRHSCYFCQKLIQNMSRHFETIHNKEQEIIRISVLPKNSLRRRNEYGALIKAGDFYHNCEVLATKTGELILVRRPTERELVGTTYMDYGPCPKCLGFLLKRHLWHHVKYGCTKSEDNSDEDSKSSKLVLAESTAIVNGILHLEFPTNYLNNVVEKLRGDEIGLQIKNDPLILRFGAFMYEKYGDTQLELIRQNMRQLSRFLLELKKLEPKIKCISEALDPEHFDFVIEATKKLCMRSEGQIANRPKFNIPSLALKIGYALKKCIGIERGQALRRANLRRDKMLTSFEKLLQLEWNVRISSNALASLHSRKLNNTELLPLTGDLLVLSKFLEQEMKATTSSLKEKCSAVSWSKLASLTLARIVLFNKRRSGEAARMTIEQYSSRPLWDSSGSEAVKESLSLFEQELAKNLILVKIIGKRGRHVPVILTVEMKEAIDLLIKLRGHVNILPENPFVFALGGSSLRNIRGHDAIKKWCSEANLQSPELVTGTKLRKYIATVCQVFNLTENQTDWLARHLGHDIRVHRDFYRLHDNAVELAKVSRLLIAVDQGGAQQFAGKSLDEINITELPGITEETALSDDEDEVADIAIAAKAVEVGNIHETDIDQTELRISVSGREKRKITKASFQRQIWTTEQSTLVLNTFKQSIKMKQLPGKSDCEKLINSNPALFKDRKWTHIKFYIKNHLTKIDRMKGNK